MIREDHNFTRDNVMRGSHERIVRITLKDLMRGPQEIITREDHRSVDLLAINAR